MRALHGPVSAAIGKHVVAAHVRSLLADHLMDVPSSDRHTVKPWFAGKLDFAPEVEDLSAQGFTLAGGRLDYIDGRTVAALVYRRRQHIISVLTWPAGAEESPKAESLQGFHVVHWVKHGMAWWPCPTWLKRNCGSWRACCERAFLWRGHWCLPRRHWCRRWAQCSAAWHNSI
jgi:anti-sigma factor RsiW